MLNANIGGFLTCGYSLVALSIDFKTKLAMEVKVINYVFGKRS
jgi:hypothetical protein